MAQEAMAETMTHDELVKAVRKIQDRQDIWDCLVRYCRAVDRLDVEMLASVYHPDAVDDHGGYVGPAEGFLKWSPSIQGYFQIATTHAITNHSCEIDGDTAHCETYWLYTGVDRERTPGSGHYIDRRTGRYIDRFERRNGEWKIAARVTILDCDNEVNYDRLSKGKPIDGYMPSKRDRSDASYARPLEIDPSRFKITPPYVPKELRGTKG